MKGECNDGRSQIVHMNMDLINTVPTLRKVLWYT